MDLGLSYLVRRTGIMPVVSWDGGRVGASGLVARSFHHANEHSIDVLKAVQLLSLNQLLDPLRGLGLRGLDEVT